MTQLKYLEMPVEDEKCFNWSPRHESLSWLRNCPLLWNPKIHYPVHKVPSFFPVMSQMNPVQIFPPYFPKIHSNIILLCSYLRPVNVILLDYDHPSLFIMQSSPASRHFLPHRSKYSPQHPVLKHNLCSSHSVRDQVSHPYKTVGKIIVLYILIFKFLETRQEVIRVQREW